MKVIFDVESIHGNLTGIGRYSYELASQLPSSGLGDLKYWNGFSFQPGIHREEPASKCEGEAAGSTSSLWKRSIYNRFARAVVSVVPSTIKHWIRSSLRAVFSGSPADPLANYTDYVFHGPNFFLPRFLGKKVVTVHDMSVFRFPEYHPVDRVRFMSKEVPKALAEADGVIAISEFTKRELLEFFPFVEGKVYVVPNGVNKPKSLEFTKDDAQVIEGLKLVRGEFFLCVSTVEPRKNLSTLLEAYLALPEPVRVRYPLVLVGGDGWKSEQLMEQIRSSRESNVRYLGYTDQNVLEALYKSAKAFVFPSLYEGFGLPAIEAMSFGLPVVCAKSTAVAEVCGGSALEFEGGSPEDLTAWLHKLATDIELVERLRVGSLTRSKMYSWERCCNETAAVYSSVLRKI